MEKRKLGRSGLEVSAIGLGCVSISGSYGEPDEQESIATIKRAIDIGITSHHFQPISLKAGFS
jgi:aryl-alcohol dehydrogenase-like predicted oxidoreductase